VRPWFPEAAYIPRIAARVRPYSGLTLGCCAVLVATALVGLLVPWPLKILVDSVLEDGPLPGLLAGVLAPVAGDRHRLLIVVVAAGLVIAVAQNSLLVLNNYIGSRLKERLILDFRSELFQHAQRLSLTFHDQQRTGDLMNRITYLSASLGSIVLAGPPLLQSLVTLVGMFWIAFRLDALLALLSLTVVPFIYYSVGFYASHVDPRLRLVKGMEGQTMSIIHEAMAMLRVIVAFGREQHEYQRFRRQGEQALNARVRLTVDQTLFSLVVNTLTALGTALVLGFGAYRVLQRELTVGELLVIMAYIAAVYTPLQAISNTMGTLKDQLISAQMAFELLDIAPEIHDAPSAVDVDRVAGRIRFEHVHFAYESRAETLKGINLEARPGQVVAIVGPTGAGKTTLASLIPRFYDPSKGRITLDDRDLRDLTLSSLRRHISVVLQEPLLFSTTIAENIRYGRLDATDDEVVACARAANAQQFIEQLPHQYETTIGERGVQLSGGERQRIAVARAFLKNAPILILDEPTSSIDSKTEAVILDALDRLMIGRTAFIIAHRLSTVRHADLIVILDRGAVVEQGTHDDLMRLGGQYRQMYNAQHEHEHRRARASFGAVRPQQPS
jgi:ATP-binding cassette subfamily B protein/subfamily B ATP-binding cassette protein MsbA